MVFEYKGEIIDIGTRVSVPLLNGGFRDGYIIEVQVDRDTQTFLSCRVCVDKSWPSSGHPEWFYFEQLDWERKQKRLI